MQKLSTKTLAFLEEQFELYKDINRLIAIRKYEMDIREPDTNIGGGRSSFISDPTAGEVIKHMSDPYIIHYEELRDAIESSLKMMNDEQKEICELKFWSHDYYTWVEVADKLHYSPKTIYNRRYKILELLAINMGMIT